MQTLTVFLEGRWYYTIIESQARWIYVLKGW